MLSHSGCFTIRAVAQSSDLQGHAYVPYVAGAAMFVFEWVKYV
jgi:hypothetical protein